MVNAEVQHESILLPGYWCITSFGKLTHNPLASSSDLRIRAYLAPLDTPKHSAIPRHSINGGIREMFLPVGELPRLHLDAVLKDGQLTTLKLNTPVRRVIDCERANIKIIERLERDNQGQFVIPVRRKWEHLQVDPDRNGLFIAIGSKTDPYATIIPAIEVFRFFYATSDVLARFILSDRILDPDTYFWDTEKSAMLSDGHAIVWLRKHMLDADARFLARFALNPYATSQAQDIFCYLATTDAPGRERAIRALPPFQETVSIQVSGVAIGGPDGDRFLVKQIVSCNWRPPFTHLKWDRDNDGRRDPYNRQERPPSDWKPGLLTSPSEDQPEPARLAAVATPGCGTPCNRRHAACRAARPFFRPGRPRLRARRWSVCRARGLAYM